MEKEKREKTTQSPPTVSIQVKIDIDHEAAAVCSTLGGTSGAAAAALAFSSTPSPRHSGHEFRPVVNHLRIGQHGTVFPRGQQTNLVNAFPVEDVVALDQLATLNARLVIRQADEAPLGIASSILLSTAFAKQENSSSRLQVFSGGNREFRRAQQRRQQSHIFVRRFLLPISRRKEREGHMGGVAVHR